MIAALYPNFVAFSTYLWSENLYTVLLLTGLLLVVRGQYSKGFGLPVVAGMAFGLGALTREASLLAAGEDEIVKKLGEAGIALARVVYDEWIPMHNKFALVEAGADRSVIFGSFNWSRPSQRYNHEIGVIAHDLELFSAFADRWDVLAEQVRVHEGAQ